MSHDDWSSDEDDVACPFCKEEGFDLWGLKMHLGMLWCEVFNEVRDDS